MKLLTKYKDEALVAHAERALGDEPTVDPSRLNITSENGTVFLRGTVKNSRTREHIVNIVRQAYQKVGLKYDRIVDELVVG